jgi:hypothetical protein
MDMEHLDVMIKDIQADSTRAVGLSYCIRSGESSMSELFKNILVVWIENVGLFGHSPSPPSPE